MNIMYYRRREYHIIAGNRYYRCITIITGIARTRVNDFQYPIHWCVCVYATGSLKWPVKINFHYRITYKDNTNKSAIKIRYLQFA
jgi:hypothetical protein